MTAWASGVVKRMTGDASGAGAIHRAAIELASLAEEPLWLLPHRHCLGLTHLTSGSLSQAKAAFMTNLDDASALGALMDRSYALGGLGRVALIEGDAAVAERYFREAAAQSFSFVDRATAWTGAGDAARARGDLEAALASYRDGIETLGRGVSQSGYMLAGRVAAVLIGMGRREEGATIMGALAALGRTAVEAGPWGADPEVIAAFSSVSQDESLVAHWRAGERAGPRRPSSSPWAPSRFLDRH